jgi:hypothetical protein
MKAMCEMQTLKIFLTLDSINSFYYDWTQMKIAHNSEAQISIINIVLGFFVCPNNYGLNRRKRFNVVKIKATLVACS